MSRQTECSTSNKKANEPNCFSGLPIRYIVVVGKSRMMSPRRQIWTSAETPVSRAPFDSAEKLETEPLPLTPLKRCLPRKRNNFLFFFINHTFPAYQFSVPTSSTENRLSRYSRKQFSIMSDTIPLIVWTPSTTPPYIWELLTGSRRPLTESVIMQRKLSI